MNPLKTLVGCFVILLLVILYGYTDTHYVVSYKDAMHIKIAFTAIKKISGSIDYAALTNSFLHTSSASEIRAEIKPFEGIIGSFETGLIEDEEIKVDHHQISYDVSLDHLEKGRILSLLTLLKAKALVLDGEYYKALQSIFLVRNFAINLAESHIPIAVLVKIYIKNLSSSLLLHIIQKSADESVVAVTLYNLMAERDLKDFGAILQVEKGILLRSVKSRIFDHLRRQADRDEGGLDLSYYPGHMDMSEEDFKIKINTIYDQIEAALSSYYIDINRLETEFINNTSQTFDDLLTISESSSNIFLKKAAFREIVDSLDIKVEKIENENVKDKIEMFYKEYPNILLGLFVPALIRVHDYLIMDNILDDLLKMQILLRLYQMENGKYPENLDDLKKISVTPLLIDPYSQDYYRYEKKLDDHVLVWSVGPDLEDNMAKEMYNSRKKKGDVFIRSFK